MLAERMYWIIKAIIMLDNITFTKKTVSNLYLTSFRAHNKTITESIRYEIRVAIAAPIMPIRGMRMMFRRIFIVPPIAVMMGMNLVFSTKDMMKLFIWNIPRNMYPTAT